MLEQQIYLEAMVKRAVPVCLPKVDLERALQIAEEIEEDWVRAEALTHVAIEQAKSDPDVALKLLDEAILELKDEDECYFEDVRALERIAMQLRMLA